MGEEVWEWEEKEGGVSREIPAKRSDGKCSDCARKKAVTREGFCRGCLRRRLNEVDFRYAPGLRARPRGFEKREQQSTDAPRRSDLKSSFNFDK